MRGTFKLDAFSARQLNRFVEQLNTTGVDFTIEWKRGNKLVTKEEATALFLKHDDRIIFQQVGKHGLVLVEHLPESQRPAFLAALKQAELYNTPDLTLGVILTLVFIGLVSVIILPASMANHYPEEIMMIIVASVAISLIGLAVLYHASGPGSENRSLVTPMVLMAPGVMACAPSSLLMFPLLHALLRRSLHSQINSPTKQIVI